MPLLDHPEPTPPAVTSASTPTRAFTRTTGASVIGFVMVLGCLVIGWLAKHWIGGTWVPFSETVTFRVSGFSMAPTLMGRSESFRCGSCVFQGNFPVAEKEPAGSSLPPRADVSPPLCPYCGRDLFPTGDIHRADRLRPITADSIAAGPIARGDFVAIKRPQDGVEYVKRIVGIPGDTIGLRGRRLTVNDRLIERTLWAAPDVSPKPLVQVHVEPRAGIDRWRYLDGWWVYHHCNPYRDGQPLPISDDYPVNVGITRRLEPVTGLVVRGTCQDAGQAITEIAFWVWGETLRGAIKHPGKHQFVSESMTGQTLDTAQTAPAVPVDRTHPIAIQTASSKQPITDLQISRLVSYRLRSGDDASRYPITLAPTEYFVLGDNVPISDDSRRWGPTDAKSIISRLEKVPDEPNKAAHHWHP